MESQSWIQKWAHGLQATLLQANLAHQEQVYKDVHSAIILLSNQLYNFYMEIKDPPLYNSGIRQPIYIAISIKHSQCNKLGMNLVVK